MKFPQLIDAQLRGATVRYSDMVRFYFKSGEVRLHNGTALLLDGNGVDWRGIGKLGRISAVNAGPGGAMEEIQLSLMGDARILTHLDEDTEESSGQFVERVLQFFDIRQYDSQGAWVEWQPLDQPIIIFRGKMGPLEVERAPVVEGQASRVISVRAVNAFVNRRKPPFAFYSHRDQQARTGGVDNIFINTSRMSDVKVRWPAQLA